jgi:molybdopterin synthase sulfur carrier subunit
VGVEVRIPTVFRRFTQQQGTVEVTPGTIGEVLTALEARYPELRGQLRGEDGRLHRFVNVYVNDEDVRYLDELDTRAGEGDTISLLPSVAGG